MQTLVQDLRFGARMLLKKPGLTVVALIVIALGVGANTAIFSVVNTVLLKPLPFTEPARIVAMWEKDLKQPVGRGSVSYPNYFDWRAQNKTFEQLASYHAQSFTLTSSAQPAHLEGQVVSGNLFTLLGAKPVLGRSFTFEDEKPGGTNAGFPLMLSHALWQRQFGSDPEIVGKNVILNQQAFTVVGVMPEGFQFPIQADAIDLWTTLAMDSVKSGDRNPTTVSRGFRWLDIIGRLKPDVTLAQAQADMDIIAQELASKYPDDNKDQGIQLHQLHLSLVENHQTTLWILLGAVVLVLLIACANVANLLLAAASGRSREMAVRAALGAGRWRIVRQLLMESLLLSVIGGALGLLTGVWGIEAMRSLIPENVPRLQAIRLDGVVFGVTLLVTLLTGLIFGLAPALQASRIELTEAMKEGARSTNRQGKRLRSALVIGEIAVALILLVGAGLLVRSLWNLQQVRLGFDPQNVLTARISLPETQYRSDESQARFFTQLVERVKTVPGVISASAVFPLPLGGSSSATEFVFEGRETAPGDAPQTRICWATQDYLTTMKSALVKGREITLRDQADAPMVAVVNETFVRRYLSTEEPLGKRLRFGFGKEGRSLAEIVGVMKDVRHERSLSKESRPEVYLSYAQAPLFGDLTLVVRTATDPANFTKAIQAEVAALDKDVPLYEVRTMEQYLGQVLSQPAFSALLFGLFAVVALLMSAVGLYGVMAYSVTQRTNEIGIRLALGARNVNILAMVIRQGMMLALIGVAIGLVGAFAITRLLSTLLFGVNATDPMTFVVIALLLTAITLLACLIPALRAARTDPMVALRCE